MPTRDKGMKVVAAREAQRTAEALSNEDTGTFPPDVSTNVPSEAPDVIRGTIYNIQVNPDSALLSLIVDTEHGRESYFIEPNDWSGITMLYPSGWLKKNIAFTVGADGVIDWVVGEDGGKDIVGEGVSFETLTLKDQAAALRRALKKRCPTLSVHMATGTAREYVDIAGSEANGAFSREEAAALRDLGIPATYLGRGYTVAPEDKAALYRRASLPQPEAVNSWEDTGFSADLRSRWASATEGKLGEPYRLAVRWSAQFDSPEEALAWYKAKHSLEKALQRAHKHKDLPTIEEKIKASKRDDAGERAMRSYAGD